MTGIAVKREPLLDIESCDGRKTTQKRQTEVDNVSPPSWRGLLQLPWVRSMLVIGFCWDLARASLSFLGPFFVEAVTRDPLATELAGAASWLCLLAGPCLGHMSDRWDRKRLMAGYMSTMGVSTVVVGLALLSGHGTWRLIFALMLILSFCGVLDNTTRMPLASDLLAGLQQEQLLSTMVAMRTVGYNIARVLGCQLVGLVVEYFGFGMSFLMIGAQFTVGMLLSLWLPQFAKAADTNSSNESPSCQGSLCSRAFVSIFGVTVIANFFYWSNQPLIPVLGTELGTTPSEIGLLSSASFLGGLAISVLLVRWNPRRTGILYCVGIALADVALAGAAAPSLAAAFVSLLCAGGLASLFGTVQAAMVMSMAPSELRGRALGLLSLSIGAGPFGMAALGQLAASFGAQLALFGFALAGATCQALWLLILPDALHVQRAL